MTMPSSISPITTPPGIAIGPGRETSQTSDVGSVEQGLAFVLKFPGGTKSQIFVPYAVLQNSAAVEAIIAQRVAAIQAINPNA